MVEGYACELKSLERFTFSRVLNDPAGILTGWTSMKITETPQIEPYQ